MRILDEVKGSQTIGISGHIRPDGDCVGACMGMALFLRKAMPQARVDVFLGDFSQQLRDNVAGVDTIRSHYDTDVDKYDSFICLDCEKERLGDALKFFVAAGRTINIDHHISNSGTGMVNLIVPQASSTCELVYDVIDHDLIDEPIARNLYIGMVTDTGVFQYSNTSKRTMEIAGDLMTFGFDYPAIVRDVFYKKSYVQQQMLGRALLESIRFMDGKCICSVVDRRTMDFYKATSKDVDGISAALLNTSGVICSIFMYETQPLTYKVSMRSTGEIDVAKICEIYGGGGHMRAAGCTVNAPYHDVINNISNNIAAQLAEN